MHKYLVIVLALALSQQAFSQSCIIQGEGDAESAALSLEAGYRSALVQSEQDLRQNRKLTMERLLEFLPKKDASLFLTSLTFNENGLTGYRYDILVKNGLSYSEAYSILSLFGAQSTTGVISGLEKIDELDYSISSGCDGSGWEKYYCHSRATCRTRSGSICTSNC
ncbi:MAG: hypothetical protein HND55_03945 [Pseudomonadota bacterium]|nr:MAG: hypothetical protein HND55_03945 [Pseudomonadota bacterium]